MLLWKSPEYRRLCSFFRGFQVAPFQKNVFGSYAWHYATYWNANRTRVWLISFTLDQIFKFSYKMLTYEFHHSNQFFLTVFKSLDRKMIIWNSATWIFEFVIPRKIIIFDIKFLKLHNLNWLFSRSFKKGNSKYLNSDRWFSK